MAVLSGARAAAGWTSRPVWTQQYPAFPPTLPPHSPGTTTVITTTTTATVTVTTTIAAATISSTIINTGAHYTVFFRSKYLVS